jgi:hypothetical protein
MHSKRKGNIGSFGIGLELAKLGYSIFTEEGDISKIDIIAEKEGTIIRIQSKAITPKDDCLVLELQKCGPNYRFKYEVGFFDYFGIWDLTNHKAYLVPSTILVDHNKAFKLRLISNNNHKVNMASDYCLNKILS